MSVDIDGYCNDPSKYFNLPEKTRDYYNNICTLRTSVSKSTSGIDWSGVGNAIPTAMVGMLQGIFSPQGLEMISIFMGVDISGKLAMNAVLRAIARGAGPEVMDAAADMAAKEGASFVNNAILTSVLSAAVEEGSAEAIALSAAKIAADAAETATGVLMVVQLLTAVLDAWDPEGFGNALDGTSMTTINTNMNSAFVTSFLSSVTAGTDEFGNPINTVTWPVEYYADNVISSEKKDVYRGKYFLYVAEYLRNLTVNSDGNPIIWPKDTNAPLINTSHFDQLSSRFSSVLANQNSVIANWINRFLPIIIIILVIAIFIFVFLIK